MNCYKLTFLNGSSCYAVGTTEQLALGDAVWALDIAEPAAVKAEMVAAGVIVGPAAKDDISSPGLREYVRKHPEFAEAAGMSA